MTPVQNDSALPNPFKVLGIEVLLAISLGAIVLVIALVARNSGNRPTSGQLLREANDLYSREEYLKAIPLLERSAELHPDNKVVLLRLAFARWKIGDRSASWSAVQEGLRRHPGDVYFLDLQGDLYSEMGELHEAARCYEAVVEQNPLGYWEPWIKLAETHQRLGDVERARSAYLQVLVRYPGFKKAQEGLKRLEGLQVDAGS